MALGIGIGISFCLQNYGSGGAAVSGNASATGATEITFTLTSSNTYVGVEWGVNPIYTWAAFDAVVGTSHSIVIDAADGVVAGTTYIWRPYTNTDPLDGVSTRVYSPGGTVSTASAYDADATAVFNAMATMPDTTRKGHINTLVTALKTAGIWTLLDHFVVCANTAAADGLLDWKNPSTPWVTDGTPTFTSDRGYTVGRTSTSGLRGPANLTTLSQYTQDSAHVALWCRTAAADSVTAYDSGTDTGTANIRFRLRGSTNGTNVALNHANVSISPTTDASGFWLSTRPSSTATRVYRNGTEQTGSPFTITSAAVPAHAPVLGRSGATYGMDREFALVAYGADVNSSEQAYYDAVSAYMTAVGAA